jgi:hypothetical protein
MLVPKHQLSQLPLLWMFRSISVHETSLIAFCQVRADTPGKAYKILAGVELAAKKFCFDNELGSHFRTCDLIFGRKPFRSTVSRWRLQHGKASISSSTSSLTGDGTRYLLVILLPSNKSVCRFFSSCCHLEGRTFLGLSIHFSKKRFFDIEFISLTRPSF